jgi:hypothetical protein
LADKILLALRSLVKAKEIDANHPRLFEQLVRFSLAVSKTTDINPNVKEVVDKHWKELIGGKNVEDFVKDYVQSNEKVGSRSITHLIAEANVKLIMNPDNKSDVEELLFSVRDDSKYSKTRSLDDVTLIYKQLLKIKSSRVDEFKNLASQWFPMALVFKN